LQLKVSTDIDYVLRTATASIHVGRDAYSDNQTILEQFERRFQLLEFKDEFEGHTVEIVVDNARYCNPVWSVGTEQLLQFESLY
jgi:hypothetical protein